MILIALGANIDGPAGSPAQSLQAAVFAMAQRLDLLAVSHVYRSPAWPQPSDQPDFLNAVVAARAETAPAPTDLLDILHAIEAQTGRTRSVRNAARPLDLDLIDYAGLVREGPGSPHLPHPRMVDRAFVLLPLRDVAPDWVHPVSGQGIAALCAALPPGEAIGRCDHRLEIPPKTQKSLEIGGINR